MIGLSSQGIVPNKIGKNWEDVATDCFKILLWHLHGGTEECSEEHQDNVVPLQISVSHMLPTNQTTLLWCAQKGLCFWCDMQFLRDLVFWCSLCSIVGTECDSCLKQKRTH